MGCVCEFSKSYLKRIPSFLSPKPVTSEPSSFSSSCSLTFSTSCSSSISSMFSSFSNSFSMFSNNHSTETNTSIPSSSISTSSVSADTSLMPPKVFRERKNPERPYSSTKRNHSFEKLQNPVSFSELSNRKLIMERYERMKDGKPYSCCRQNCLHKFSPNVIFESRMHTAPLSQEERRNEILAYIKQMTDKDGQVVATFKGETVCERYAVQMISLCIVLVLVWNSAMLFARGWKRSRYYKLKAFVKQGGQSTTHASKGGIRKSKVSEWMYGFLWSYFTEAGTPVASGPTYLATYSTWQEVYENEGLVFVYQFSPLSVCCYLVIVHTHLVVRAFYEQEHQLSFPLPSFSIFEKVRREHFAEVRLACNTEQKSCQECARLRAARDQEKAKDGWSKANSELKAHLLFAKRERLEEEKRRAYAVANPHEVLYLSFDQTGSFFLPKHKFPNNKVYPCCVSFVVRIRLFIILSLCVFRMCPILLNFVAVFSLT
jgi:hypothetical protein